MAIAGAKCEMTGFRTALQETIFQGLGPAFTEPFTGLMPVIGPGMKAIAQGINQNILQVFDTLQTPQGKASSSACWGHRRGAEEVHRVPRPVHSRLGHLDGRRCRAPAAGG